MGKMKFYLRQICNFKNFRGLDEIFQYGDVAADVARLDQVANMAAS